MKTRRLLINIALIVGLILSIFALIVSAWNWEWNTVAATLAVITAIVSAWATQKIIWKQETDQEPLLEIYFDTKSRQDLVLLVIENNGGSSAYDIMIKWIKPLLNNRDEIVHFGRFLNEIDIPVLNRGQKCSYIINSGWVMFDKSKKDGTILDFSGRILYKLNRNDKINSEKEFIISLEPYRNSPIIETEQINFYYEGAKIHSDLKKIGESLDIIINGLNINRIPRRKTRNQQS